MLLLVSVSLAIFRFFFGLSEEMASASDMVLCEALVPTFCKRSSFFLLVPAITGLGLTDDAAVVRVTVVEEDPPEFLERVDVADARLCMAAVKFDLVRERELYIVQNLHFRRDLARSFFSAFLRFQASTRGSVQSSLGTQSSGHGCLVAGSKPAQRTLYQFFFSSKISTTSQSVSPSSSRSTKCVSSEDTSGSEASWSSLVALGIVDCTQMNVSRVSNIDYIMISILELFNTFGIDDLKNRNFVNVHRVLSLSSTPIYLRIYRAKTGQGRHK